MGAAMSVADCGQAHQGVAHHSSTGSLGLTSGTTHDRGGSCADCGVAPMWGSAPLKRLLIWENTQKFRTAGTAALALTLALAGCSAGSDDED